MDSTRRGAIKEHGDLFVVHARMAEDRTRAAQESLARVASDSNGNVGDVRVGAGARVWLGRRLVAAGTALAGDRPAPEPRTTTGQPC
jgi:hypothetical protein